MKKNKNGFTLVELLATIVILGILSVLSIPVLTGTINKSRNKMYINDAKRLVAQVEYEMKASSSIIEKPKAGKCIIISLGYLNTTAISTGPNGGEYDPAASYVVIKNVNGKMEYSVAIVEIQKKGKGYKGIELTKSSSLNGSSAYSKVKPIVSKDLVDVNSGITRTYINNKLGSGYISQDTDIVKVYHVHDIIDPNINNIKKATPVIKSISISSVDGSEIGALRATLAIKADDADTPRNNLTIIIAVNGRAYGSPLKYSAEGTTFFYHTIDFGSLSYNYLNGGEAEVTVTVKDPEGHTTTKKVSYKIHKNSPPEFYGDQTIGLTDPIATPYKAAIRLNLRDDLTANADLRVCFSETIVTNCSPYQNYATNGPMYYTFSCPNGCKRDGSVRYLYVYLKDKHEAVTRYNDKLTYTFPKNAAPHISNMSVIADGFEGINTIKVKANITDDMDVKKAKLYISDGGPVVAMNYKGNDVEHDFTVSGPYDGSTKTISIYVIDSEGAKSNTVTTTYKMYLNLGPVISNLEIDSDPSPCIHDEACGTGGNLNTTISYVLTDDLSSTNQLKVCMSEDANYCDVSMPNHFVPYSSTGHRFTFSGIYDGGTRNLYFKALDPMGAITAQETIYGVYQDKPPIIANEAHIERTENSYDVNLLDFYYYVGILDDIEDKLTYSICYKMGEQEYKCVDNIESTTGIFHLNEDFFGADFNGYYGQNIYVYAKAKDSRNEPIQTPSLNYVLYNDASPVVVSSGITYEDDLKATVNFVVKDYFDEYQVGINIGDSCDNVEYYNTYYDGTNLNQQSITYQYEDTPAETVLCVKDKNDHVTTQSIVPVKKSEYVMCSNKDYAHATYQYTVASGQQGISRERCNSKCYAYNPINSQHNLVQGFYNRSISYFDQFNSLHLCPAEVDDYIANCSFIDCFRTNDTYHKAIGVVPVSDNAVWTVEVNGTTYRCNSHYKLYQSSYTEGDEAITLSEIEGQKICSKLINDESFMSDYVVVVDQFQ